jgi:hypothetical protein
VVFKLRALQRVVTKLISGLNLRWLFSETLVIVLGILIALGLDDFRTAQFERRLAIDYVQRIQSDLNEDLDYIERVWNQRIKLKRESLDIVAPVIRGQSPVPSDVEGFLKHVARAGISGTSVESWYRDTTFEDMRTTGNLRLIQDPGIRAEISEYYEVMQREALRVEARLSSYALFVHSVLPAELRDGMDLEAMEAFGIDYALKRLLTDEFRNLLNQEYNLMLFMEGQEYREIAQSLYEKLKAYQIKLEGA